MIEKRTDVVLIGAGLAGLATAIRLTKKGYNVTVFEKNLRCGGKLEQFERDGFRFDKGPSLLTEPRLIDELFLLCEKDPRDYFNYHKQTESCRYFFSDLTRTVLSDDPDSNALALDSIASDEEKAALVKYLKQSESSYKAFGDFFISRPKPAFKDLFTRAMISRYPYLLKRSNYVDLHHYNQKKLQNSKLVQIMDRFGTYNGSNPYQMSSLFHIIPHVELNEGSFFPVGGMRAIIDSLEKLAAEIGVEIVRGVSPTIIKAKDEYIIEGDDHIRTQKVVCAIDHLTFYKNVYPNKRLFEKFKNQERSSSGLILYIGLNRTIRELGLHNILFSKNYEAEFHQIFNEKRVPDEPTFYIHISQRSEPNDAPDGKENWFVMVNVPAGIQITDDETEKIKLSLIGRIKEHFDTDITDDILFTEKMSPMDLEQVTGGYGGALYGAASNGMTASIARHANTRHELPGIYFCGGTVHPGGGIPLVLRSAKIVSDLINDEK